MSAENGLSTHQMAFQEDSKPNYSGVPSQAVDAVRMRSAQLTHSLRRLRDELSKAELPQWYSLQSQLNVTLSQLMSLSSTMQHFQDVLDSTVVYPLPSFPTTSHEGLLTTLLRKKNVPEVDDWMASAREASELDSNVLDGKEITKALNDDKEISKWALQTFVDEFEKHNYKGFHTREAGGPVDEIELEALPAGKKPVRPFDVEDVLRYTYRGEMAAEQPPQDNDAEMVID